MSKINDGGPAFPQFVSTGIIQVAKDGSATIDKEQIGGMSLRADFAGRAMQGMLAGYWSNPDMGGLGPQDFAADAVAHADALIAELDKNGPAPSDIATGEIG